MLLYIRVPTYIIPQAVAMQERPPIKNAMNPINEISGLIDDQISIFIPQKTANVGVKKNNDLIILFCVLIFIISFIQYMMNRLH